MLNATPRSAMYASHLGDFFNVVAAFQSEMETLERQIELERRDPLAFADALGLSIDSLMVAARDMETHLANAQDLLRDTQGLYRRMVSGFFCRSAYVDRALKKPRGYAGDYMMLEMLYRGEVAKEGVERTLDRYLLDLPVVRSVVARKNHAKRWLGERLARDPGARALDLACGSCRIERELIEEGLASKARFVGIDHDPEALSFVGKQPWAERIELVLDNALQLARGKSDLSPLSGTRYAVCLGLFDYLPHEVGLRLLRQLRNVVEPGGEILVGNFTAENPSQAFMEWTVDWPLVYRSSHDFFELFLDAGFAREDVSIAHESELGLILIATARVSR